MRISLSVPYDERQMRRTLTFLVGRQAKIARLVGAVGLFAGILLLMFRTPVVWAPYVVLAASLYLLFGMVPVTVAWSMRSQAAAAKEDMQLTLDEEGITLAAPRAESRLSWAGIDRMEETAEVWYAMFGKLQAVPIPKDLMTEAERTTFADFVSRWQAERQSGRSERGNIDRTGESS